MCKKKKLSYSINNYKINVQFRLHTDNWRCSIWLALHDKYQYDILILLKHGVVYSSQQWALNLTILVFLFCRVLPKMLDFLMRPDSPRNRESYIKHC